MARPSKITPHRQAIERWLEQRLSIGEIARRLGVDKRGIWYWMQRWGLHSRLRPGHGTPIRLQYEGEEISLHELARRTGIDYLTLYYRWHKGDRGEALVRPPRPAPKPQTYDLGLTLADYQIAVELADQIGIRNAQRKTGIPRGAINAARRGEWERLE